MKFAWLGVASVLVCGCGPSVENPAGSGGGSSSTGAAAGDTTAAPGESETAIVDESSAGEPEPPPPVDPGGICPVFEDGLMWLWCGDVDPGAAIAADDDFVYFTALEGGLWRVPLSGGDAVAVVVDAGKVFDLAVEGDALYWTNFETGTLGHKVLPDGSTTIMSDTLTRPNGVAVGGGFIFVTQYGDDTPLLRFSPGDTEGVPLYPGLDHAGLVTIDNGQLLFAESTNDGNIATPLLQGDFEGGPLVTLFTGPYSLEDFAREGDVVWWALYDPDGSSIMRTITFPELSSEVRAETEDHPFSIVTTPDRVFWSEWTSPAQPNGYRVRSILRDGGEPLLHHSSGTVSALVMTPAGIVFATQGAIALML